MIHKLTKYFMVIICIFLFGCASTDNGFDTRPPSIYNSSTITKITKEKVSEKNINVQEQISVAFSNSEWTAQEKRAFTMSLIGHALDLISSLKSDERCVERNPILGTNPSDGALIGMKLLAIGFEYWLYNNHSFRSQPTHYYGYTSTLIHTYAGISNFQNDCY